MTETRSLSFRDAVPRTSLTRAEEFLPDLWEYPMEEETRKAMMRTPTLMAALMAGMLVGTGGVATANTIPRLYDSPIYRVLLVDQAQPEPSILLDTRERVAAIRRYFSLNITDLAKVLRIERPTVYAWLQGKAEPHPGNLKRLEKVYRLARDWRTMSVVPAGKYIREPFENDRSMLDYLSAEELDESAIQHAFRLIKSCLAQDAVKSTVRRRSVGEVAKLHGFAPVPEHIQKKNFDEETAL
jgi:transcriptional regulator with XRE-family HTH domain